MMRLLRYSPIAGVLFLIFRYIGHETPNVSVFTIFSIPDGFYATAQLLSLVFFVIFILGFVTVGKFLNNKKLIVASYIFIIYELIFAPIRILGVVLRVIPYNFIEAFPWKIATIVFASTGIFFGYSILKLHTKFGKFAHYTGLLTIIISLPLFIPIFDYLIQQILWLGLFIPSIMQIVLLQKIYKQEFLKS